MADLNKIGLALSGFSAGVAGQLPQFQAGLERRSLLEQQQAMSKEKDQLTNNRVVLNDLQNGNIDRVITNLTDRLVSLNNSGENTDATMGMLNLVKEGGAEGIQEAIRISQAVDQQAVIEEMLDPVEAEKPISRSDISSSGTVTVHDGKGGFKEIKVEGFTPDMADGVNSQISGTKQVKDSEGNLFNSATVFDPATGQTRSVMTPLGDSPDRPIGKVQLVDASGLTPTEQIEQAGLEAGTIAASKASIAASADAFTQLQGIESSINMLAEVIPILDSGVDTGPVISRLPSFRQAAIELDNMQARMGLNIIQNTTFGSLQKAEMDLALNTALPTNLQPAALKKWVLDKHAAQTKLSNYMKKAASYLGTPGNTIPKWLDFQRQTQILNTIDASTAGSGSPQSSSTIIEFDAQGNIIQ
jgi:hypothetical protein